MKQMSLIVSRFMRMLFVVVCYAGCLSLTAAEEQNVYILSASEWNVPRTTEAILAMPALQYTVQAYNKTTEPRLQIRYPGGDEGTLWAHELRSWFVALGIASQHIELMPGSRDPGQIEMHVINQPAPDRTVK